MKAAWYEKQGPAREVLKVGDMPDPIPDPGEVRIRVAASDINPGDIRKREDAFRWHAYPCVIPHSDGAGQIDRVGDNVSADWSMALSPFRYRRGIHGGPLDHVAPLPEKVAVEQGACLGIPGITAHRAVHVAGPVSGRTVLMRGAAGAVGLCVVQPARTWTPMLSS
jgi:NADPH2:quinone reductase